MQATVSDKRIGLGRFGGSLAAVGITAAFAAGIVTGIAGQTVFNDTTDSTGATAAIVRPMAHYSAGQGEGLVSGNAALDATLKAHYVPEMGEGLLTGELAPAVTLEAYAPAGQGEGIIGGYAGREVLTAPVRSGAEIRFLEMNTLLPFGTDSAVRGFADIRFLELNTLLPGVVAPKVQPYTKTRFLEINQLPEDGASYLPSPRESQPAGTPY